jgi:hypothetical protein
VLCFIFTPHFDDNIIFFERKSIEILLANLFGDDEVSESPSLVKPSNSQVVFKTEYLFLSVFTS